MQYNVTRERRKSYSTSTITIEWSEIPASRSACEYLHDRTRDAIFGVAKQ
jgi:hypothetical protein